MPRLAKNTVLGDPATGAPVALLAGSDLPQWAKDLVGDHLLAEGDDTSPSAPAGDGDGEAEAEPKARTRRTRKATPK